MSRSSLLLLACACAAWAADTNRGALMLEDAGCLQCHSVRAQGAGHEASGIAPELGAGLAPVYTAPALASAVWNHTPAMLAEMSEQRLNRPPLAATDWEDLFAYLYSVQFLEFPAEASRGKAVFENKQCAGCHSLSISSMGPGRAVLDWRGVEDPLTLVYDMWSHAAPMDAAGREATWTSSGWTKMSGRDFQDLTAYFQQLQRIPRHVSFTLPDAALGQPAFNQKCGSCHAGPLALETSLANATLANTTWMDIGAGMWNHVTVMRRVPWVSESDMRKILAYVWELQYRGPQGNPEHGQKTFSQSGCASCHSGRASGKTVTPASLAAIGWGEGRVMHQRTLEQGITWPHLSAQDVADLVAYLNSISGQ